MTRFLDSLNRLFSSEGFVPRRHCGLWPDWLIWEHVAGNGLVCLAYVIMPVMIWRFGLRRTILTPFRDVGRTFAVFIGLCGLGHFLDLVAFFHPIYRLSGLVLIATGLVSCWTAWLIGKAWPNIMEMRSPSELEAVIAERTTALAELELAHRDRFYLAAIIESADQAIIGKNFDGVVNYWNAGAERLFGYPAVEAIGQPITFLIPPDRLGEEVAIHGQLLRGQSVDHLETVRRAKDGREIDVSLTISPIKDPTGRVIGFSKIAREITEQKRAVELLRRSEEEYRILADAMPQIVWTTRADGHIYYCNKRWYEFTGHSSEQAGDNNWTSVIHPDDVRETVDLWNRAVTTGEVFQIKHHIFHAETSVYRWHISRAVSVKDDSGKIIRWIGTSTDIHEEQLLTEALRRSEEHRRLALTVARIGHWEWDVPNDRITYLEFTELLYGRPEGHPFRDYADYLASVHPDDQHNIHDGIKRTLATGAPYEADYRLFRLDGSVCWLSSRGTILYAPDGTPERIIGVNLDITDQKELEKQIRLLNEGLEQRVLERTAELIEATSALLESERRFRAIFDSTFQFIGLLTPEGNFLEANKTSLDFAQLTREDIVGRPAWETAWCGHGEEARDRLKSAVAEAREGRFVRFEQEYQSKDGQTVTVDFSLMPILDESGRVVLLIPEGRDISERKKTEEALRQSEARTRAIFDTAVNAIMTIDDQGRFESLNPAAERLFGYPATEIVGQCIQLIMPEPYRSHDNYVDAYIATGQKKIIGIGRYVEGRRKDGSTFPMHLTVSEFWLGDRRMFTGIAQDISEQQAAEVALREARDAAMAASRAKSEFLANMSHEIRTPMNGVLGMTELLLDTQLNDLQRNYTETIQSSGQALLTVINDILDFSKIEAGKLALVLTEFDLRELMEEVVDLLIPSATRKSLELSCRVARELPRRLMGDPVRIRQVLTNLAGNAVKFTASGRVVLEASLLAEDVDTLTLRISVRDTGIGIPEHRQADIFESFTQIEGGNSRPHGGTGLGLTICQSLIALMGGRIGLESRVGEGSTFWFVVTLQRGSRAEDPSALGLVGLRVLVVSDQEADREILMDALLSWDCRPEVVPSVSEALTRLVSDRDDHPFGLVVIDQDMPGMDGEQTTRMIRAMPRYAKVPIVQLGSPEATNVEESAADRWNARMTRPIHRSRLYNLLCGTVTAAERRHDKVPAADSEVSKLDPSPRVLLAEDNKVNRAVAIGMLKRLGCEVEATCNGREVVETLDYHRHDLILMDVQMPEMDGFAATAAIRQRELVSGRHIPIVAMTAHAMEGDRERCLAAGMDGYMSKPIRPGPLREALLAWGRKIHPATNETGAHREEARPSPFARSLQESFGDDVELIRKVLGLMLKDVPVRLERLEAAIAAGDSPQLLREAHTLKGAFATVGAETLASACQELMSLAEGGDLAAIENVYRVTQTRWRILEAEANRYLPTLAP